MSEFSSQSGQHHLSLLAGEESLCARLRALEPRQTNAVDSTEMLDLARASLMVKIKQSKNLDREAANSRKEVADAIRKYQRSLIGARGQWTALLDEIRNELGVSPRGIYRIIALSNPPARVDGKARASRADHAGHVSNLSTDGRKSTTDLLMAETEQRASKRLRRKIRSESDEDFFGHFVGEIAERVAHTKTHSKDAAVWLVRQVMKTTGVRMLDLDPTRIAPD